MSSKKISKIFVAALVLFAGVFDLLSLIPGMQAFVMVAGQVVLGCLFYAAGVNVFKHKQAILFISTAILEAIPAASALPFFLVQTLAIIGLAKAGKI